MTLVYCWFDHSPNSPHGPWPWVVADSRFSYPGDTQQILLDEGAKIFSFPLTIREKWGHGNILHSTNIGLTFAGSTLVSHNTMLCLASICGNLVLKDNENSDLSLADIASITAKLVYRFTKALASLKGSHALADLALIGWCPKLNRWRIFHLRGACSPEFEVKTTEFTSITGEELLILGDASDIARQEVEKVRATYTKDNLNWWRAPGEALLNLINRDDLKSIGGFPQVGTAVQATYSFNLSAVYDLKVSPSINMKFLGMDVQNDIGDIGPCFVGMSALPFRNSVKNS